MAFNATMERLSKFIMRLFQKLRKYPAAPAVFATLVIIIAFTIISDKFLNTGSISGTMSLVAELGVVTVGVSILMISGHFDLSVGSVFGIGSMVFALLAKAGWSHEMALIATLTVCALMGYVNGILVVKTKISSFIVTLGAMMLWRGVLLAITGGFPIIIYNKNSWVLYALAGNIGAGFRTSIFWVIALTIIFSLIMNRTRYGNAVLATGGEPKAARALGINVNRTTVINFMLCAMLAGFAGVIQFSRFMSVDALRGKEYELQAIASAVIGGVLLTGGYGSIIGAVLGVLIIAMVKNGLILAGASPYWYRAFIGVILVMAAIVNMRIGRRVSHE